MAFYALLFSKNADTSAVMKAACKSTGIRVEVCEDIFTAIEKGKTQAFSCVIADWAEQPEASFLLKRARESTPNRNTVAIAIVDHDPSAAELRDNRLDFLIYRPISVPEAEAVLTKASEKMQPSSAPVVSAPVATEDDETTVLSVPSDVDEPQQALQPADGLAEANAPESNEQAEVDAAEEEFRPHAHAIGFREVCATVLMLALAFCLWKSRGTVVYLSRTPEGTYRVLRESVEAYFYKNQTGALPVGAAGSDAQQDAYFSRDAGASSSSNANADARAGSSGHRIHADRIAGAPAQGRRLSPARARVGASGSSAGPRTTGSDS
jgi:DNA-binding response OmpR family regulator